MTAPLSSVKREPLVVVIDDKEEDYRNFAEAITGLDVAAVGLHPDEVELSLLRRASVIVVDQYLDDWSRRDDRALPPTLAVPDGLALTAVLRSHVDGSARRNGPPGAPTAIVLRTGELDVLAAGLPRAAREHLFAAQYDLEWVLPKGGGGVIGVPSEARRIADLASATARLPTDWGPTSEDPGLRWLSVPDVPWAETAQWQIEQCRPPQHVVAERTAGRAWLRWFLHRILPFPTFLLDPTHLAVALGITGPALDAVLLADSPLSARLDEMRYQGPLDSFVGQRWWRAGASHLLEEVLGENEEDDVLVASRALSNLHGAELPAVGVQDPVVGLHADYVARPEALSAADSVRLQPDGWPPYADDPWAPAGEVTSGTDPDPDLAALVVLTDRWRLRDSGA